MPGVARPERQHPRGTDGRGDADHRADIAEIARALEKDQRRALRLVEQRCDVDLRPPGEGQDARGRGYRRQIRERRRVDLAQERGEAGQQVGREPGRERGECGGIRRHRLLDRRAEA